MDTEQVAARVRKFVDETFLYMRRDSQLGADDSLMATGVVDSMGVMEMIAFLEEEFGVIVADDDVTEANLGTLNAITKYIAIRRAALDKQIA